jgi:glutathione S-transferase
VASALDCPGHHARAASYPCVARSALSDVRSRGQRAVARHRAYALECPAHSLLTRPQILWRAASCLTSLDEVLSTSQYLVDSDRPTSADAYLFAFIACLTRIPLPDATIADHIKSEYPYVLAHCAHMHELCFGVARLTRPVSASAAAAAAESESAATATPAGSATATASDLGTAASCTWER